MGGAGTRRLFFVETLGKGEGCWRLKDVGRREPRTKPKNAKKEKITISNGVIAAPLLIFACFRVFRGYLLHCALASSTAPSPLISGYRLKSFIANWRLCRLSRVFAYFAVIFFIARWRVVPPFRR
jgi:hypothetical protein